MSLSLSLSNALTGLNVAQRSLGVLSQNIANVNTPGYSRQLVEQSAQYVQGVGAGVRVDQIARKVDEYLQRSIFREGSGVQAAAVMTDYMDRVQILLGEPGSGNTMDVYLNNFLDAVQSLADAPESASFHSTAVDSAATLAREIGSLAASMEDLRYQADQDISAAVTEINRELKHLDAVNAALDRTSALGGSTAGLLDERDAAIQKLSEYMDITLYYKANGTVNVFLGDGTALIDDNRHELLYTPASGSDKFIDGIQVESLRVATYSVDGRVIGDPKEIISSGVGAEVTTVLEGGKLLGLQQMRDKVLPDMLAQLDQMAAQLRDVTNAIHNDGSGFPGANQLTGTRMVQANQTYDWTGSMRIAVLMGDGTPIPSPYADEANTGIRPMTIDLSMLRSGEVKGSFTVQQMIDEINSHFGPPPTKSELGAINNIQLVSNQSSLPYGSPASLTFDFDLENITDLPAGFFVTDVTAVDNLGASMGPTTTSAPKIALAATNTYATTIGEPDVTVTTSLPHGLAVGDIVYLPDPGTSVGGLPGSQVNGYFKVTAATNNTFTFEMALPAAAGGPTNVPSVTATPTYTEVEPGEQARTQKNGAYTLELTNNLDAEYYDITVQVGVANDDGTVSTGSITYRVPNKQTSLTNQRYDGITATGAVHRESPASSQPILRAILVDANGNELAKESNDYLDGKGYLKLVSGDESYTISIDEMDSRQMGVTSGMPLAAGTNRGFSHFFELNNFFASNEPNATGDTVRNSAINMRVEQRLIDDPNLISVGDLAPSQSPKNGQVQFTFQRNSGDNSVIQRMAGLAQQTVTFDAAGKLPNTTQTFASYLGEMLGSYASQATTAASNYSDSSLLLKGLRDRNDAIKGVNLDEELANTITYQSAYTASARVITTTNEMFQTLLDSFR